MENTEARLTPQAVELLEELDRLGLAYESRGDWEKFISNLGDSEKAGELRRRSDELLCELVYDQETRQVREGACAAVDLPWSDLKELKRAHEPPAVDDEQGDDGSFSHSEAEAGEFSSRRALEKAVEDASKGDGSDAPDALEAQDISEGTDSFAVDLLKESLRAMLQKAPTLRSKLRGIQVSSDGLGIGYRTMLHSRLNDLEDLVRRGQAYLEDGKADVATGKRIEYLWNGLVNEVRGIEDDLEAAEDLLTKKGLDFPFPEPREGQAEAAQETRDALVAGDVVACAPTGFGKSFARGERMLRADGSAVEVQDIEVNDLLLGPNGAIRRVLKVTRGRAPMARVIPKKGRPFVVTQCHILTLAKTGCGEGCWVDVHLSDYLAWSKTQKHLYKLVHSPNRGSFFGRPSPEGIPPYVLGVFLGDGGLSRVTPQVTKPDVEIHRALAEYADDIGMDSNSRGMTCSIIQPGGGRKPGVNVATRQLTAVGVQGCLEADKHVPEEYLHAPYEDRLELLAGLLDTDGCLIAHTMFEFSSKSRQLIEAVEYLAWSVGLAARVMPCSAGPEYQRVGISGDCSIVPTRIRRKQAQARRQVKDVCKVGFSVELLPEDDFYGFVLDGDQRFCLSDFTVTHNSAYILSAVSGFTGQAYVITPQRVLVKQYMDDFGDLPWVGFYQSRASFRCKCQKAREKRVGPPEDWPTCSDFADACELTAKDKGMGSCPYAVTRDVALSKPVVVMTAAMATTMMLYQKHRFPMRAVIAVDECQRFEETLMSACTTTLKYEQLVKDGWTMENDVEGIDEPLLWPFEDKLSDAGVKTWVSTWLQRAKARLAVMDPSTLPRDELKAYRRYNGYVSSLNMAMMFDDPKLGENKRRPHSWTHEQANERFSTPEQFTIKPMSAVGMFDDIMGGAAVRKLMVSATPGTPEYIEKTLGLKYTPTYMSYGAPFPPENRPVLYVPTVRLNYRSPDEDFRKLTDKIVQIATGESADEWSNHAKQKGIIHTVSNKLHEKIVSALRSARQGWRLREVRGSKRRLEIMEEFMESSEPLIMLGPAITDGVSLSGDQARWGIVTKLPWPPPVEPSVKHRMDNIPDWYAFQVVLSIVQACGRNVRSKDDWAVNYILDEGFETLLRRSWRLFPPWFLESIVKL